MKLPFSKVKVKGLVSAKLPADRIDSITVHKVVLDTSVGEIDVHLFAPVTLYPAANLSISLDFDDLEEKLHEARKNPEWRDV